MGRNSVLIAAAFLAALTLWSGGLPVRAASPIPVRMVKLGGSPGAAATLAHVRFCRSLGFNAIWVYGHQAGAWTRSDASRRVRLNKDFLRLAQWCREHGMKIFVSINPVAATRGRFQFHDRRGERRIRKFIRALRRKAGVHDFVLSFDDMPTRVLDLNDFLHYGRSSAPAHLDLAARLDTAIRPEETFWLAATAYCDAHLGDGNGPYSSRFLAGLAGLPGRIGLVWTGPQVVSPEITGAQMAATRRRLGGRKILLYDNYPVNDDSKRLSLGLILGPLRNRDAGLVEEIAVYLSCPMTQLGASRLPLRTVAAWLADPAGYDPDATYARALKETAGDDPQAFKAIKTQALEWGDWIGGRNYRHLSTSTIYTVVPELLQPAYVAQWGYTERRYPGRMKALEGLADTVFRDDLLLAMERRLAVARAFPLIVEYRTREAAHRPDTGEALQAILDLRDGIERRPTRLLLERFLEAAEVPDHVEPLEPEVTPAEGNRVGVPNGI